MTAQIVTIEDLQKFRIQLLADLKEMLGKQQPAGQKSWLKSSEVKKLLGIGDSKLQTLRITGKLASTKLGGICYYKAEDIEKMLEKGNG